MSRRRLVTVVALSAILIPAAQAAPQDTGPNKHLLYAPDILGVDRLFMIVLSAPVDAPELKVTVSPPGTATLFDRTPLPAESQQRRYYFRTLKSTKGATITLSHPDGDVVVPITVWSFDDLREFRKLKGTQLPRRWPLGDPLPELKESQTITAQAQLDGTRGGKAGRGARWIEKTDDEIWAMQPDSTIPRWHWVNVTHGCPIHGTEIYKSRAYYPWGKDASLPYQ
jgi:hypothetical protein